MHKRIPQFTTFLLILQGLILYAHWFVCQTIIVLWNIESPTAVFTLKTIFITLSFCFVGSSALAFRYVNRFVSWLYHFSMIWTGYFLYLFIASFFSWIVFDATTSLNAQILMVIFFVAAGLIATYGVMKAKKIKITSLKIPLPNLPAIWEKRTVVFVSDLHLGQIRKEKFAGRVAEEIRALKPDILLIGGDIYDGVATDVAKVTEPLSHIKPPLGVYFVMGNHDEFRNVEQYIHALKSINVRILDDELIEIDGLQLIGVDYQSTELKKEYAQVMQKIKIDPKKPSVLLRHVPNFVKIAKGAGVSLQLSGHTHQGQVFPITWLVSWIFKGYGYGLKKKGNMQVYVSSGVGTWGPPLRIGTKAEIVKIQFVNK